MVINTEKLKELKPCTDRFRNWLEHYSDFEGSFCEFLDLDKITYDDKIYVIKRLVPRETLEQWAIMCAESVLYIFESIHPNDKRPRECIDYLKTGDKNKEKLRQHRIASAHATNASYAACAAYASYAAAYASYAACAAYASYAAAYASYAAAYASYAAAYASYAVDAAAYAVDAAAAYAVDAAAAAYAERSKQKDKNIEFLKSLLNNG